MPHVFEIFLVKFKKIIERQIVILVKYEILQNG